MVAQTWVGQRSQINGKPRKVIHSYAARLAVEVRGAGSAATPGFWPKWMRLKELT